MILQKQRGCTGNMVCWLTLLNIYGAEQNFFKVKKSQTLSGDIFLFLLDCISSP